MKIQIKKFHQLSLDELYQLLQLRVNAFVVEQKCPYPELDNADQAAIHFFASADDQVIGYLRLLLLDETKAKISRVVTAQEFRGKGLSRNLVKEALTYLKPLEKISSVVLQSQAYLTDFYASFGFEKTSEVYLEDDIPHIDMELLMNGE